MKEELIKNIAGGIDLPKRAFDNAELLLKKLFGSVVEEVGGMLGDAIRSRRFKNQVNIFSKAQELLKSKGLEPKQINLKLLVPLIEYSSLEEDETIQNKWANMIANISTDANEDSFNKKCVSILNELSTKEVLFLDKIYSIYTENDSFFHKIRKEQILFSNSFSNEEVDLFIDRLISFALLKDIHTTSGANYGVLGTSMPTGFKLTKFGFYFIELCKFDK